MEKLRIGQAYQYCYDYEKYNQYINSIDRNSEVYKGLKNK